VNQPDLLSWRPRYPQAPASSSDDTSIAAADSMRSHVGTLRAKVMERLRERPLTVHECARLMGESVPTVQPRFSELRAMDQIEDSRERRMNDSGRMAIVWRIRA
jgi:DNA-binding transcriptional ArsR family regulator